MPATSAPQGYTPQSLPDVTPEAVTTPNSDPTEIWPSLQRRLAILHQRPVEPTKFLQQLASIKKKIEITLKHRPDDSLFVLVQMLSMGHYSYCATHALLCAVTCQIIAPLAGMAETEVQLLTRAALTMNISISSLQDALALQSHPMNDVQRDTVHHHPTTSAQYLRKMGVTDERWLALVEDHHESPDGKGYPKGKAVLDQTQQLLRMADLFVARISPRTSRRGLSPNLAVGNIYLEAQETSSQLGAIFVKQLGMYPPGTYVRLKSQETAVVVRRGERVNAPVAMAIANDQGMPLNVPARRDTELSTYNVEKPLASEEVKVRVDTSRMLKRV